MKDLRPSYSLAESVHDEGGVFFWSRAHSGLLKCPAFVKIRHYLRATSRPVDLSNGIPNDGTGERVRFFWWRTACNTWQYLVSGPWSPAGNRGCFPLCTTAAIRCERQWRPRRSRAGTRRGRSWGPYRARFPYSPLVPPSCGVPTRVDFLQITLGRVEVRRRRAHLRVCVIMRKMSGYF